MKNFTSRTGMAVAASAAAMSVVSAFLVPYGHPWPSVAWAVLACAAAIWATASMRPSRSMSDVIANVDAEPERASATAERGVVSTRRVS